MDGESSHSKKEEEEVAADITAAVRVEVATAGTDVSSRAPPGSRKGETEHKSDSPKEEHPQAGKLMSEFDNASYVAVQEEEDGQREGLLEAEKLRVLRPGTLRQADAHSGVLANPDQLSQPQPFSPRNGQHHNHLHEQKWKFPPNAKFRPSVWATVDAASFLVRDPGYAVEKLKKPSLSQVYQLAAVDVYSSPEKVGHMGRFVRVEAAMPEHLRGVRPETLPIPICIILHFQIPDYAPPNPVWGKKHEDGEGYGLTHYLYLSEEALRELQAGKTRQGQGQGHGQGPGGSGAGAGPGWCPAVDLLANFVRAPADSELKKRLKLIARICNLSSVSLNGPTKKLVDSYNATPFLVRTTSSFFHSHSPSHSYFEIDIDVHRFSYLSRVGVHGLKSSIGNVVFDVGVVVQGEEEGELPERLLAAFRLSRITLKDALPFPLPTHLYHHHS